MLIVVNPRDAGRSMEYGVVGLLSSCHDDGRTERADSNAMKRCRWWHGWHGGIAVYFVMPFVIVVRSRERDDDAGDSKSPRRSARVSAIRMLLYSRVEGSRGRVRGVEGGGRRAKGEGSTLQSTAHHGMN